MHYCNSYFVVIINEWRYVLFWQGQVQQGQVQRVKLVRQVEEEEEEEGAGSGGKQSVMLPVYGEDALKTMEDSELHSTLQPVSGRFVCVLGRQNIPFWDKVIKYYLILPNIP